MFECKALLYLWLTTMFLLTDSHLIVLKRHLTTKEVIKQLRRLDKEDHFKVQSRCKTFLQIVDLI